MSETPIVTGDYVTLDSERYYRIANSHLMPDFFMSLVGASDHWMFISSNGALTAGRCDPDSALFPYGSDDQISAARSETGPITLVRTGQDLWEPFAPHSVNTDVIRRNLFKTPLGNKLVFAEINETRQLAFRYRWAFSERFGFVRTCRLQNTSNQPRLLQVLDGLRNVLPYGVGSEFMLRFSNLGNAYKKNELLASSGLGLFYLSSIPTDRAEPCEGLKATTVWQTGLSQNVTWLSTEQLATFRSGGSVSTESDVRGRAGAYLAAQTIELGPGEAIEWHIVAELAQDHAGVIALEEWLHSDSDHAAELKTDIDAGETEFLSIVSSADALQCGANARRANRHLSNTVFNVMRGGIPLEDYRVDADDFRQHVSTFNQPVSRRHVDTLTQLPETIIANELQARVDAVADPDLSRLTREYLPLAFSRRHGDPTRPWNRFAIHLRTDSGRTNLDYQGNWRDIFQNWEALAFSFPEFTTAMICRFVNATTADGYNPYRLTKDGFEWEEPIPDDPWANIGYWGDHQIIYLLKLLEWNRRTDPAGLNDLLTLREFVHANVPYRIKPFDDIKQNPQDTIEFDAEVSRIIADRVAELGADGKLVQNQAGEIHRVTLFEKLLTLCLAKLSNFVPDGGIWLNTQRPEWNDANNALVGNGISMVTACYLHRWFVFLIDWLEQDKTESFACSHEVALFVDQVLAVLTRHDPSPDQRLTPRQRATIVESLSRAGSDYRTTLYTNGITGDTVRLTRTDCLSLFDTARKHLQATIRNNRRPDGLYHSYNLLEWREDGTEIEHLHEMLEGQVAVLSSGLLSADESNELLTAMRSSALYRENQNSYMLYPDRQLPRFLQKNNLNEQDVADSPLLTSLLEAGNEQIVRRDVRGSVHFNGRFKNANDLRAGLASLPDEFAESAAAETDSLANLFIELFGHRQFTGRSGTFFAYEGLGSIYWHMVSKLGLAVLENAFAAIDAGADASTVSELADHFRMIRAGVGAEKTPTEYGAFPSDPYSHTPENAGVKQPGMTGQVKEDILARFAELGVHVQDGAIRFRFELFDRSELLDKPQDFTFCNLAQEFETLSVPAGAFAFTLCQVPIVYHSGNAGRIDIVNADGSNTSIDGLTLDPQTSEKLFARTGDVKRITVFPESTDDIHE